jgi:hypothetical protein
MHPTDKLPAGRQIDPSKAGDAKDREAKAKGREAKDSKEA